MDDEPSSEEVCELNLGFGSSKKKKKASNDRHTRASTRAANKQGNKRQLKEEYKKQGYHTSIDFESPDDLIDTQPKKKKLI